MFQKKVYLTWNEVPCLISLEQAAILLGIGIDAVRKHCVSNELPAVKIGRFWYIDKQRLMEQFGYVKVG